MKEELGLDHFEGRSWRGFHHHAAMVMLAYGFLLLERERVRGERERAGGRRVPRKKGSLTGH
jgi:SRSO17 transposase